MEKKKRPGYVFFQHLQDTILCQILLFMLYIMRTVTSTWTVYYYLAAEESKDDLTVKVKGKQKENH